MGLTNSEIINIVGIVVSAFVTIGLFLIIRLIITRIKGPRLSIFGYREKSISSGINQEHREPIIDSSLLPKPRWFVGVSFEMLNIGDTIAKFYFNAKLELHDITDKQTQKPMTTIDVNGFKEILEPGVFFDKYLTSFGFLFEDIDAFKWKKATISIIGYYYDHKSNKKEIEIDSQVLTNPKPIRQLDIETKKKINDYNKQQQKLQKKQST